jgi:hypothetical protein
VFVSIPNAVLVSHGAERRQMTSNRLGVLWTTFALCLSPVVSRLRSLRRLAHRSAGDGVLTGGFDGTTTGAGTDVNGTGISVGSDRASSFAGFGDESISSTEIQQPPPVTPFHRFATLPPVPNTKA